MTRVNFVSVLETEAKLRVQYLMRTGTLEYVWSDMLVVEAGDCPIVDQREKILAWRHGASLFVEITSEIERNAGLIMELGVKSGEALHSEQGKQHWRDDGCEPPALH